MLEKLLGHYMTKELVMYSDIPFYAVQIGCMSTYKGQYRRTNT